jgi:hypothetical protein
MAQALADQPESKPLDDNLADNDHVLLNFDVAKFEIVCQMSYRMWKC